MFTDLSARDDLESLSYIAFCSLRGTLPWKPRPRFEPQKLAQEAVRVLKSEHTGSSLGAGFPSEFADLLDYSRFLQYNQLPDYDRLKAQFEALGQRVGYVPRSALD